MAKKHAFFSFIIILFSFALVGCAGIEIGGSLLPDNPSGPIEIPDQDFEIIIDGAGDVKVDMEAKKIYFSVKNSIEEFSAKQVIIKGTSIVPTFESDKGEPIGDTIKLIEGDNNFKLVLELEGQKVKFDVLCKRLAVGEDLPDTIVSIKVADIKTKYKLNEEFEEGKIELVYSSGRTEFISLTKDMVPDFDTSKAGAFTFTIVFKELKVPVQYTVEEVGVIGISFDNCNNIYYLNSQFVEGTMVVSYADGTKKDVTLTLDMVQGFSTEKEGKLTLFVTYENFRGSFEIEIIKDQVSSIEFTPNKTHYNGKEEFGGGELLIAYESGKTMTKPVTIDMLDGFDTTISGLHSCYVVYEGVTTEYLYEVENYIASIEVKGKTEYYVGDRFFEGELVITYGNGMIKQIASVDIKMDGFDTSTVGEKNATIYYEDQKITFKYIVIDNKISSVVFDGKKNYSINEKINGSFIVKYESGKEETKPILDSNIVKFDTSAVGSFEIILKYMDFEIKEQITVVDDRVVESIDYSAARLEYFVGEEFEEYVAVVKYTDNSTEKITVTLDMLTGFTTEAYNHMKVYLTYRGYTLNYYVSVKEDSVASIELISYAKDYYELEQFKGGEISVKYKSGKSEIVQVTPDMLVNFNTSTIGEVVFGVSYRGASTEGTINIKEDKILEASFVICQTEYYLNQEFTATMVAIKYESGKYEETTPEPYMIKGFDTSTVGEYNVVITIKGKELSYTIKVREVQITEMKLLGGYKSKYILADSFGYAQLYIKYENNSEEYKNVTTDMLFGFYTGVTGSHTAEIRYKDQKVAMPYEVFAKREIVSINIVYKKTDYYLDEEYGFYDTQIDITYNDDSISSTGLNYEHIKEFDTSVAGEKLVKFVYEGHEISYTINVIERNVQEIILSDYYLKTIYYQNEELSPISLEVVYDTGNMAYIDSNNKLVKVEGFTTKAPGTYTVTVSYRGAQASFNIEVKELTVRYINVVGGDPRFKLFDEFKSFKVDVGYDNSTNEIIDVTLDMLEGFTTNDTGNQFMTLSYRGFKQNITYYVEDNIKDIIMVDPKLEYKLNEEYVPIKICIELNDGRKREETITLDMLDGFNSSFAHTSLYRVPIYSRVLNIEISVVTTLINVKVSSHCEKYYLNSSYQDITVSVEYDDGNKYTKILGIEYITGFKTDTVGSFTAEFNYLGFKGSFDYTVINPIISIEITEFAEDYFINEEFKGAKLLVTRYDKSTETVEVTKAMISNFTTENAGDVYVTVKYSDYTTGFTINVIRRAISIEAINAKDKYYLNSDLSGFTMIVTYDDGYVNQFYFDPFTVENAVIEFDTSAYGSYTLRVTYEGVTLELPYEVVKRVVGAEFKKGNHEYLLNEKYKPAELIVRYEDNTTDIVIYDGAELDNINTSGYHFSYEIINYEGILVQYNYIVVHKAIEFRILSYQEKVGRNKTTFYATAEAVLDDGTNYSRIDIDEENLTEFDTSQYGMTTVKGIFHGYEFTLQVEIVPALVESKVIPVKTNYLRTEEFQGATLIETYDNGDVVTIEIKSEDLKLFDTSTPGKHIVEFWKNGYYEFEITVSEEYFLRYRLGEFNTEYRVGDTFVGTIFVIRGEAEEPMAITADMLIGFDTTATYASQNITIKYETINEKATVIVREKLPKIADAKRLIAVLRGILMLEHGDDINLKYQENYNSVFNSIIPEQEALILKLFDRIDLDEKKCASLLALENDLLEVAKIFLRYDISRLDSSNIAKLLESLTASDLELIHNTTKKLVRAADEVIFKELYSSLEVIRSHEQSFEIVFNDKTIVLTYDELMALIKDPAREPFIKVLPGYSSTKEDLGKLFTSLVSIANVAISYSNLEVALNTLSRKWTLQNTTIEALHNLGNALLEFKNADLSGLVNFIKAYSTRVDLEFTDPYNILTMTDDIVGIINNRVGLGNYLVGLDNLALDDFKTYYNELHGTGRNNEANIAILHTLKNIVDLSNAVPKEVISGLANRFTSLSSLNFLGTMAKLEKLYQLDENNLSITDIEALRYAMFSFRNIYKVSYRKFYDYELNYHIYINNQDIDLSYNDIFEDVYSEIYYNLVVYEVLEAPNVEGFLIKKDYRGFIDVPYILKVGSIEELMYAKVLIVGSLQSIKQDKIGIDETLVFDENNNIAGKLVLDDNGYHFSEAGVGLGVDCSLGIDFMNCTLLGYYVNFSIENFVYNPNRDIPMGEDYGLYVFDCTEYSFEGIKIYVPYRRVNSAHPTITKLEKNDYYIKDRGNQEITIEFNYDNYYVSRVYYNVFDYISGSESGIYKLSLPYKNNIYEVEVEILTEDDAIYRQLKSLEIDYLVEGHEAESFRNLNNNIICTLGNGEKANTSLFDIFQSLANTTDDIYRDKAELSFEKIGYNLYNVRILMRGKEINNFTLKAKRIYSANHLIACDEEEKLYDLTEAELKEMQGLTDEEIIARAKADMLKLNYSGLNLKIYKITNIFNLLDNCKANYMLTVNRGMGEICVTLVVNGNEIVKLRYIYIDRTRIIGFDFHMENLEYNSQLELAYNIDEILEAKSKLTVFTNDRDYILQGENLMRFLRNRAYTVNVGEIIKTRSDVEIQLSFDGFTLINRPYIREMKEFSVYEYVFNHTVYAKPLTVNDILAMGLSFDTGFKTILIDNCRILEDIKDPKGGRTLRIEVINNNKPFIAVFNYNVIDDIDFDNSFEFVTDKKYTYFNETITEEGLLSLFDFEYHYDPVQSIPVEILMKNFDVSWNFEDEKRITAHIKRNNTVIYNIPVYLGYSLEAPEIVNILVSKGNYEDYYKNDIIIQYDGELNYERMIALIADQVNYVQLHFSTGGYKYYSGQEIIDIYHNYNLTFVSETISNSYRLTTGNPLHASNKIIFRNPSEAFSEYEVKFNDRVRYNYLTNDYIYYVPSGAKNNLDSLVEAIDYIKFGSIDREVFLTDKTQIKGFIIKYCDYDDVNDEIEPHGYERYYVSYDLKPVHDLKTIINYKIEFDNTGKIYTRPTLDDIVNEVKRIYISYLDGTEILASSYAEKKEILQNFNLKINNDKYEVTLDDFSLFSMTLNRNVNAEEYEIELEFDDSSDIYYTMTDVDTSELIAAVKNGYIKIYLINYLTKERFSILDFEGLIDKLTITHFYTNYNANSQRVFINIGGLEYRFTIITKKLAIKELSIEYYDYIAAKDIKNPTNEEILKNLKLKISNDRYYNYTMDELLANFSFKYTLVDPSIGYARVDVLNIYYSEVAKFYVYAYDISRADEILDVQFNTAHGSLQNGYNGSKVYIGYVNKPKAEFTIEDAYASLTSIVISTPGYKHSAKVASEIKSLMDRFKIRITLEKDNLYKISYDINQTRKHTYIKLFTMDEACDVVIDYSLIYPSYLDKLSLLRSISQIRIRYYDREEILKGEAISKLIDNATFDLISDTIIMHTSLVDIDCYNLMELPIEFRVIQNQKVGKNITSEELRSLISFGKLQVEMQLPGSYGWIRLSPKSQYELLDVMFNPDTNMVDATIKFTINSTRVSLNTLADSEAISCNANILDIRATSKDTITLKDVLSLPYEFRDSANNLINIDEYCLTHTLALTKLEDLYYNNLYCADIINSTTGEIVKSLYLAITEDIHMDAVSKIMIDFKNSISTNESKDSYNVNIDKDTRIDSIEDLIPLINNIKLEFVGGAIASYGGANEMTIEAFFSSYRDKLELKIGNVYELILKTTGSPLKVEISFAVVDTIPQA